VGNRGAPPPACGVRKRGQDQPVRVMFGIWLTLLVSGIVLYTIIGLSHH
jgi:hypothetical protein